MQVSAVWCTLVQLGVAWCTSYTLVQLGAVWKKVGAAWCSLVQVGSTWCCLVHFGASWCSLIHFGAGYYRFSSGLFTVKKTKRRCIYVLTRYAKQEPFCNLRYTKGVTFLLKIVFKKVRGGTCRYRSLMSSPPWD